MTNEVETAVDVSADRPVERPEQDLLGCAPFAKHLADSICSLRDLEGLVIALYGRWGAGKTTLLNLVRYYISCHKEDERPIVVLFNPWWFSGQENLARSFLGQLRAALPDKYRRFKKLGTLIAEYADGISATADACGLDFLGIVARCWRTMFPNIMSRDVPGLKEQISNALREQNIRVLVIVDDIDRLTPDDLLQLFKVIKALADFPNVVYLLALDKEVAVRALSQYRSFSGCDFMDKIIQVPFELPAIDMVSLRKMLFVKLDKVLGVPPERLFNSVNWGNVYFEGIDHFIRGPRDVVRFVNSLSVTYQAVRGEVNAVDFIAIESVRLFMPDVYEVVRANSRLFTGSSGHSIENEKQKERAFHNQWIEKVPEALRTPVRELMIRLFPRLRSVWGNETFGADWRASWLRELRICCPEIFPVYFRLAVPDGGVSMVDIEAMLQAAEHKDDLANLLREASRITRPDGTSKCKVLLERLRDLELEGIAPAKGRVFVAALLTVGDELLVPQDEPRGMFDVGNEVRIAMLVRRLLERELPETRCRLLTESLSGASALVVAAHLLRALQEQIDEHKGGGKEPLVDETCLNSLKLTLVALVKVAAENGSLESRRGLPRLLSVWFKWGNSQDVKTWVAIITQSDDGLQRFVTSFVQRNFTQSFGDAVGSTVLRLNPFWLAEYVEICEVAHRVERILERGVNDRDQRCALEQFAREYALISEGKDPDAPFAFDAVS